MNTDRYKPAERKLYLVACHSGDCRFNAYYAVEAETGEAAKQLAVELWADSICGITCVEGELTEEEVADYGEIYYA